MASRYGSVGATGSAMHFSSLLRGADELLVVRLELLHARRPPAVPLRRAHAQAASTAVTMRAEAARAAMARAAAAREDLAPAR